MVQLIYKIVKTNFQWRRPKYQPIWSHTYGACSRAGTWAARAEVVRRLGVSNLEKNYIFGILMKNCTKYLLARSIG